MNAHPLIRARICAAAILALVVLCTSCRSAPSHRASASGLGEKLGTCEPSMVEGLFKEPTPGHPQLRALVVRLDTADPQQAKIGMEAGSHLREALNDYAKRELDLPGTGLRAADLQVAYVACVIADHDHARKIGMKADADVVFWGQVYCDWRNRAACENYKIDMNLNRDNSVRDSPGSSVVNKVDVHVDTGNNSNAMLKTSLTVVRWAGLEGSGLGDRAIHTGIELASADLPRLTSLETKLLIDFVMGLFASKAERHALAVRFFRRSQSGIEAAGIAGAHDLYIIIGHSYICVGEKDLGMQALNKALEKCDPADHKCRASSLTNLGWGLNFIHGDSAQARAYLEQALTLHQKIGNLDGEVGTLHHLGEILEKENDVRAKEYYERSYALSKRVDDRHSQASLLRHLGDLALNESLEKAKKYYESALSICELIASQSCFSSTLMRLGGFYIKNEKIDLAQSYLEQSLLLAQKEGTKSKIVGIFRMLMDVSIQKHDHEKALRYGKQALASMEQMNNYFGQGDVYHDMGDALLRKGDCAQATSYFKRAFSSYTEAHEMRAAAKMLNHIGDCLEKISQPQEAIFHYKTAAEKYLEIKPSDTKIIRDILQYAHRLALRHKFIPQSDEVLRLFVSTQPSEIDFSLMYAMRLGYTKSKEAIAAYEKITGLIPSSQDPYWVRIKSLVTAGILRAKQQHWPDCPGVVVWQVKPDSVAAKLGLSVGDVLLRMENACLQGESDLDALHKAPETKKLRLERWRAESLEPLEFPGGSGGFRVSPF